MGPAGANSTLVQEKVARFEITRSGNVELLRTNIMELIQLGQAIANMNPGRDGCGNPYERYIDKVVEDVRNGLVSARAAE